MKWLSVVFSFGFLLIALTPNVIHAATRPIVDSYSPNVNSEKNSEVVRQSGLQGLSVPEISGEHGEFDTKSNLFVLHDSTGIDKEFQMELLRSVFVALRELDKDDLNPQFIDVSKVGQTNDINTEGIPDLASVAEWVVKNRTSTLVSLLSGGKMIQFAQFYDQLARTVSTDSPPELKIFTPRSVDSNVQYPFSVNVFTLQMNDRALSIALLNRVENVGIRTLIPVLDSDTPSQINLLNHFMAAGQERLKPIKLTRPIFINDPAHLASFKDILDQYTGFSKEKLSEHDESESRSLNSAPATAIGVMMIASNGSQKAMQIAAEKKHMQLGWFSPNILQHEEWAYRASEEDREKRDTQEANDNQIGLNNLEENTTENTTGHVDHTGVSPYYGLYTVNFVGSFGWDNPTRRRVLRELTSFTGASPRILSAVLAYDTAWVAVNNVRKELRFPMMGLSGEIAFDSNGFRRDGVYFGLSAVPDLSSQSVTLLQPSTWILEDTITLIETLEGQFLIKDHQTATSTILTGDELRSIAKQTKKDAGCLEHIMNVMTHDPFNQMAYNYFFKEQNLPESLLLPNQLGFAMNFLCIHDKETEASNFVSNSSGSTPASEGSEPTTQNDHLATTLQIACTPGMTISEPIKCFRSDLNKRHRRSTSDTGIPEVQYQYGFGSGDIWNQPQNTKWSNPKDERNNFYYNYPSPYYQGTTPSYWNRRQDVSAAAEVSSTPAPSPTSKLPELRQILKAAKPFVGSCIGSTTGCAMCVLVLGRLPLGAVPAACTGPCFVGTFGTCGSLLGRVFSETTVICTELFKQGLIDADTFIADAEFGQRMYQQFPVTLQGYQLLATPLVTFMQKSELVTSVVATFALPWAHHMKFLMGRSDETNFLGLIIHTIGFPLCNIVGYIYLFYLEYLSFLSISSLILTIVLILIVSISSKSKRNNTKRSAREGNTTAALMHLSRVLGRSQKIVRHMFN